MQIDIRRTHGRLIGEVAELFEVLTEVHRFSLRGTQAQSGVLQFRTHSVLPIDSGIR